MQTLFYRDLYLRFILELHQVYNLLLSRMCHDMASPINAIGILFEMLAEDSSSKQELKLAKQSHDQLVDILTFYRILLSYRDNSHNFQKAISYISSYCRKNEVLFENKITGEQSDNIGKIVACIFSIILTKIQNLRSLSIRRILNNDYVIMASSRNSINFSSFSDISDNFCEESCLFDSKVAIPLFLNKMLKEERITLSITEVDGLIKFMLSKSTNYKS